MSLIFVKASDHRHLRFIDSAQAETATISYGRAPTDAERSALLRRVEQAFTAPGHLLMMLEDDGTPLGYFWLQLRNGDLAFLLDFYIAPERRGRGLGAILMQELIRQAIAMGATTLRLAVASRNEAAKRLFTAVGLSVRDFETREGATWLELSKELRQPDS